MERSCFTTIWCAILNEMAECMSEPRFNGGFVYVICYGGGTGSNIHFVDKKIFHFAFFECFHILNLLLYVHVLSIVSVIDNLASER